MKKCPRCKREIESNSAYCEYCGYKIKKSVWPVFLILGILIIGGGIIAYAMKNKKEAEKELVAFQDCSTINDYREFLRRYPQGRFAEQAYGKIQDMVNDSVREAQARYEEAELIAYNNCSSAYTCRQYLMDYPNGAHVSSVVMMLEQFIQDSLLSVQPPMNEDVEAMVEAFIQKYTRLTETSDSQLINQLVSELFAPNVKRYFNKYDTDSEFVAECFERYDEKFSVYGKHCFVRWNTVSFTQSDDRIYLTYVEDFNIDRKDRSKYSVFVLEKHFELNQDFKVVSVYDVQLSKSKK